MDSLPHCHETDHYGLDDVQGEQCHRRLLGAVTHGSTTVGRCPYETAGPLYGHGSGVGSALGRASTPTPVVGC